MLKEVCVGVQALETRESTRGTPVGEPDPEDSHETQRREVLEKEITLRDIIRSHLRYQQSQVLEEVKRDVFQMKNAKSYANDRNRQWLNGEKAIPPTLEEIWLEETKDLSITVRGSGEVEVRDREKGMVSTFEQWNVWKHTSGPQHVVATVTSTVPTGTRSGVSFTVLKAEGGFKLTFYFHANSNIEKIHYDFLYW